MKLGARLTLFFVLLSIVPVIIVGYIAYHNGRQTIEQVEINHLVSTNLMKSSELHRWIESNKRSILELAQRPLFIVFSGVMANHDTSSPAYEDAHMKIIQDHLSPRITTTGGFLEVFIICPCHGVVLASSNETQEGKYRTNQPYFMEGMKSTYVQGVYYSLPLQQPAMIISTPILNKQGHTVAVLAGLLDLNELSSIMSAQSGLSQSEDTYLVNRSNFFVTEPHFGVNYALKKTVRTRGVEAGLAGSDGVAFYENYKNVPVIGAYKWLPEYNMCLITEVDQAEAYTPTNALAQAIGTIVLALILIVTASGFLLARTITRSLSRLVAGAVEIGSGNLDHRVGTESRDEIGELSRAFDRMAAELKATVVRRDELERRVRERTTQLEEANREMEAFTYSVSHDLRAPLRAIDGYTRILLEDYQPLLDAEGKRICSVITDSTHKMSDLIDDLLALSRLGRSELNPVRINMEEMANVVFQELTTPKSRKRIDFRINSAPPASGDAALLRQVWTNFISNAIKFSSQRKMAVISVHSEIREHEVIYAVRDNGVGFDMQYAHKLFGVFQRLHSVKEFEGNGVGLAIVQRIIHRHGGRVWAEGETGAGASFYFSLPYNGEIS
jgi:signal transduction histidine kinase